MTASPVVPTFRWGSPEIRAFRGFQEASCESRATVATSIVPSNGSPTRLDYVMRNGSSGWKAVDVLADGSISRVAVQRSDFRHLLATGGVPALVAGLQNKVANLSGGMLA